MKCLLIIEDEATNRGGWADIPMLDTMPEEVAAKFLMNAYKEALSNLNSTPAGVKSAGIIPLVRGELMRAQNT